MVRNLDGEKLDGWLEEAAERETSVMKKFAAGLKKDLAAVRAGLTEEWSNGPVEGFTPQAQAREASGLREGWLRPAQSSDARRPTIATTAVRQRANRFTKNPTEPTLHEMR